MSHNVWSTSKKPWSYLDGRQEVDAVIGELGIWAAHRHFDPSIKCDCIDDDTPKPSCPRCLGVGHPFTDFIRKIIVWVFTDAVEFITSPGRISTQRLNCILPVGIPPNKFDRILFLYLDEDTGEPLQPFRVMREYIIQDLFTQTSLGGRTEFYKLIIEERNMSSDRKGDQGTKNNSATYRQ